MPAKPLNQLSGMPQMSAAFMNWFVNITIVKITQSIIDSLNVDTQIPITFKGTVQPLKPQEIALKPEGERSWKWMQIHALSGSLDLTTGDKIIYKSETYKVMGMKDYSLNNYVEYHIVKDYQNG